MKKGVLTNNQSSLLFVQLVTHTFGELVELAIKRLYFAAPTVSTIRF